MTNPNVQQAVPHLSPEAALRLELSQDLSESSLLAIQSILATGMRYIWGARQDKKQAFTFRSNYLNP